MKNCNQKKIKKITNFIIITFIFSSFFSSCITLGNDFPHSNVKYIKTGKTTKDDIRKLFGSPWLSGINNGELSWTYGNYDYSLFGEKKAKDLQDMIDSLGKDNEEAMRKAVTDHAEELGVRDSLLKDFIKREADLEDIIADLRKKRC